MRAVPGSRTERNSQSMSEIVKLLDRYHPDIVVLENWGVAGSRRSERMRRLYRSIAHGARTRDIEVRRYTRADVSSTYASVGAVSRYEIAQATAREFPAFAHRLPRSRKTSESERKVIGLFQAAALCITCYRDASAVPE